MLGRLISLVFGFLRNIVVLDAIYIVWIVTHKMRRDQANWKVTSELREGGLELIWASWNDDTIKIRKGPHRLIMIKYKDAEWVMRVGWLRLFMHFAMHRLAVRKLHQAMISTS